MPTISNVSFSVKFDLTGAPALVLTDTTTSPPTGLVGIFSITQPDGYTRTGDINSPDIPAAGDAFTYTLRLASDGGLQCGTYTIVYTAAAPSYLSTDFTRSFEFNYEAVSLDMEESFDVFTPELLYIDNTDYAQSGYSAGSVTRAWTAVSTPTGTLSGSSATFDMIYDGEYYDANYVVTLTSSLTYTHSTYSWLTIDEEITKSVSTYAQTPPTITEIVEDISALKLLYDEAVNTCSERTALKADFEWAQTLFIHILDKVRMDDLENIFTDLEDLLTVLNGNRIPTYTPTNDPIPPYDFSGYYPSAAWGTIFGTITAQTDLVNYIATQLGTGGYAADIGNGSATTITVTHGLSTKDVQVEVFKNSDGSTVYVDTARPTTGTIALVFATAPTTNQYRVVILKKH